MTLSPATNNGRTRKDSRREFIRHPVEFSLEVERLQDGGWQDERSINVSDGGLAFVTGTCPRVGDLLRLRIPGVQPPFEAAARVAWCRPEKGSFLVGVNFIDAESAFRSRMVQQVCAIEKYRRDVAEREGRRLSASAAAAEWIERYAHAFPGGESASPE